MKDSYIKVYPNAKINLGLHVVEKRQDGFHNIETIFVPIPLHDVLEIHLLEKASHGGQDVLLEVGGVLADEDVEDNLVVKAYRLLQKDFALPPIHIRLEKHIPTGAGLGGGSADCAFMIKTLNTVCELCLSEDKMEQYASRLGADCAFFVRNTPVYATGIGDVFQFVDGFSLKGYHLVLVNPRIHVPTRVAFSGILPKHSEFHLPDVVRYPIEEWRYLIKNDFETSVFELYPAISRIKEQLYASGAKFALMSGSGSTVYGIFSEIPTDMTSHFEGCLVLQSKL